MALQVNKVLSTYSFNVKILTYVKDEGRNFQLRPLPLLLLFHVKF